MEKNIDKINKVKEEIEKIDKKENTIFFLIVDTKGNPSGSLQYIYKTALSLKDNGHNVEMLYYDDDFVGASEWLGEEVNDLVHKNLNDENNNVEVNPSDVLVIPEIYCNALNNIGNLPCKKIILFQNFDFLTETMPFTANFNRYGITDAITTSESQKEYITQCFPYLNVRVIEPGISKKFRPSNEPKKLIINIVSREQSDINRIIKPFYWRYPIYEWVSFRDLRGMNQDVFSDALREAPFTLWIDDITNFGYTGLEVLKSKNILIAKIPDNPTNWMLDESGEKLNEDVIWFDNIRFVPDMIASMVRSWTLDTIPDEIYDNLEKYSNMFNPEDFTKNVEEFFSNDILDKRKNEFNEVLLLLEKNNDMTKNEDE